MLFVNSPLLCLIFYLSLIFVSLITLYSICSSLCLTTWGSLLFLDLVEYLLSHVSEVFSYISSNISPFPILFLGPI